MLDVFHGDLSKYASVKLDVISIGSFTTQDILTRYVKTLQSLKNQSISSSGQHPHFNRGVFVKHKQHEETVRNLQLNFCQTTLQVARKKFNEGGDNWKHFQAHRTVFGVIGFCDGEKNSNVIKTFEQWSAAASECYPNTPVTQFHILNPTKEQEMDPRIRNSNSIHVYPRNDDKSGNDIDLTSTSQMEFMKKLVLRLAINFKQTFDNWLRAADTGETTILQKQGILDLQTTIDLPTHSTDTSSNTASTSTSSSSSVLTVCMSSIHTS